MLVKFTPTKVVYTNYQGFSVLSCVPIGDVPDGFEINKRYHNFSISGDALGFELGQNYEVDLKPSGNQKYANSYVLSNPLRGFTQTSAGVKIAPEQELLFLRQIMDGEQADNIHDAYPDFVQLILDDKLDNIDVKKIKNVGQKRFDLYIRKIKEKQSSIKYFDVLSEWEITDLNVISKLSKQYTSVETLKQVVKENPYEVFCDALEWPFKKTDICVMQHKPLFADSRFRCHYCVYDILKQNENEGDTRIYVEVVKDMVSDMAKETKDHLVDVLANDEKIYYDKEQGYVSLMATYNAEKNIVENIKNRLNFPNFFKNEHTPDFEKYRNIDGFNCTDEQMDILHKIWDKNMAMLMGGAGTGKTSSMKSAIKMLEDNAIDYLLLAPTGIAAKRLRECTGRSATTIHMFLGCGGAEDFQGVVVVEESSMVGVQLLSLLFDNVSEKTKFLFICDEAQLPSISCGNVVQDIIDSGTMPTAKLTKVFRYGTSGLATITTDTRQGRIGHRNATNYPDYHFVAMDDSPLKQIENVYNKLLDKYNRDDIMILSPYNTGDLGTYAINNIIQKRYNSHKDTNATRQVGKNYTIMYKVGDKVINTHNEYKMPVYITDEYGEIISDDDNTIQVMNGDMGIIRSVKCDNDKIELSVEFDTGLAYVTGARLNNLLLGYAITTHKSQGSESKAVIVVIGQQHERLLSRNLLYVADSRAKEELIEIGDIQAIAVGLKRVENKSRETWLCELLKEESK